MCPNVRKVSALARTKISSHVRSFKILCARTFRTLNFKYWNAVILRNQAMSRNK